MIERLGAWTATSTGGWAQRLSARLPRGARAVAWLGILFGILAAWVALPPVGARSAVWTVVIGLIAILVGTGAVIRGVKRLGWGAIAAGLIGIGVGYLATQSSVGKLEAVVVWSALFGAMLRYATPLVFAAIGGMFSERSGVVNIGLEGMMLMGAFFGIWAADRFESWVVGLVVAALSGGLLALVHAIFAIHLRADQIVGGTAVNFLALGITGYLFIDIYGGEGTPTDVPEIPDVHLGFLKDWYFVGPVFGQLNLMIWLAFVTVLLSWIVMFKTPIGLRIRAVGEHPRAADTVGISVYGIRYAAVVTSGMLAALGGAYLSLGFVNSFNQNMTAGRGFIALAALIFGNWRPWGAAAAALLFGFSSALADRLPTYSDSAAVLFRALPYAITLIAVAGIIGRTIPPAAIGRPYRKQ
jgi:general nucleoside transport system permease protein